MLTIEFTNKSIAILGDSKVERIRKASVTVPDPVDRCQTASDMLDVMRPQCRIDEPDETRESD